jgi:hypothetical protein
VNVAVAPCVTIWETGASEPPAPAAVPTVYVLIAKFATSVRLAAATKPKAAFEAT